MNRSSSRRRPLPARTRARAHGPASEPGHGADAVRDAHVHENGGEHGGMRQHVVEALRGDDYPQIPALHL